MRGTTTTVPGPNQSRPASDFETRNPHSGRTKNMGLHITMFPGRP